MNKCYQKSAQQAYNTAAQPYVAAGTTLNVLGAQCTDCGCSINTSTLGMTIQNAGLYYLSAAVTSTPTAAGTQVVQLFNNGVAIPCAVSTVTTTAGSITTQEVETVVPISACCSVKPVITARISGVAGTANFVRMSAFRLA